MRRLRLDLLLQERYPSLSRAYLQSLIMQGKVLLHGAPETKAGTLVREDSEIILHDETPKYVSRAGFKLERALEYFKIDVAGLVCLDAGISTGGFTDCLLQQGAKHVYGIDVAYGQIHEKVRNNPRLTVYERTNLRYVESLPEPIDLATIDLSFISVLKVLPVLSTLLKPNGRIILLIKPQFEATRAEIGKGGIVTDPTVHTRVIESLKQEFEAQGYACQGVIESPLKGGAGNTEFLGLFVRK